ncbi:MAG: Gfo/Idh/MocA family oxidoreductase [Fibrella sp.]|nr:Gfo/Idh/MocA family oxidoreductase [Armatimonadota bacterium]
MKKRARFAVIGINHDHIYRMTEAALGGGGELAGFYAPDEKWATNYQTRFPDAPRVTDPRVFLEDESIALILSACVPSDRAALGMQVMRHGKDYLCDKAAFLNREELDAARRVQQETGRIFAISYSERLLDRSANRAGELVRGGAIGRVVQVAILAPHTLRIASRPSWFFERKHYGGILTDIGSHQVEQFLYYSGLTNVEVVSSLVANYKHPNHPEFEDYGEATFRGQDAEGNGCTGFVRADWLIPDNAKHTGRHRVVMGTEGILEIGGDTLTLVNANGTERIDCQQDPVLFGTRLIDDVLNRTETAINQTHCFYASELTLRAQEHAARHGNLGN